MSTVITPMNQSLETIKSQSLETRRLEHALQMEDIQAENQLATCCGSGRTDRRLLQYAGKLTVSIITLTFCFVQLIREPESGLLPFYSSLITFVIGSFMGAGSIASPDPKTKPSTRPSV